MLEFPKWLYSATQPKGVLCATKEDALALPDEDWFLSPAHIGTTTEPFLSTEDSLPPSEVVTIEAPKIPESMTIKRGPGRPRKEA